jgi:hypothetical protein
MSDNFFMALPQDVLLGELWGWLSDPDKVCLILATGIKLPAELVPKPIVVWKNPALGPRPQQRGVTLKPEYRKVMSGHFATKYFGVVVTNPADEVFRQVKHSSGPRSYIMFRELYASSNADETSVRWGFHIHSKNPAADAGVAVGLLMLSIVPDFEVELIELRQNYNMHSSFIDIDCFVRYIARCWPPRRKAHTVTYWLQKVLNRYELSVESYSRLRRLPFYIQPKTIYAAQNAILSDYLADKAQWCPADIINELPGDVRVWLCNVPQKIPWFRHGQFERLPNT